MHSIRDIDISLLRAFLMVVETGSITAAAYRLNQTQAAVSQKIKRLESFFGSDLFNRENRAVHLTLYGERLRGAAESIVHLNDKIYQQMNMPDFEGVINFGIAHDLARAHLPTILRRFNTQFPNVDVYIESSNTLHLHNELEAGHLQLVLGTDFDIAANMKSIKTEKLHWATASGAQIWRKRPLPIILGGTKCNFRLPILNALRSADIAWIALSEGLSHGGYFEILESGIALSGVIESCLDNKIKAVPLEANLPDIGSVHITMTSSKSTDNKLVSAFEQSIFDYFQNLNQ